MAAPDKQLLEASRDAGRGFVRALLEQLGIRYGRLPGTMTEELAELIERCSAGR